MCTKLSAWKTDTFPEAMLNKIDALCSQEFVLNLKNTFLNIILPNALKMIVMSASVVTYFRFNHILFHDKELSSNISSRCVISRLLYLYIYIFCVSYFHIFCFTSSLLLFFSCPYHCRCNLQPMSYLVNSSGHCYSGLSLNNGPICSECTLQAIYLTW